MVQQTPVQNKGGAAKTIRKWLLGKEKKVKR
jgi:hypothetical protein